MKRLTELVHDLLQQHVRSGDAVVDATLGTGQDSAFLSSLVGADGQVFAFDVQADAIGVATARFEESSIRNVVTNQECHSRMAEFVPGECHGRLGAVVFNLGYLPGGDHSLVTQTSTSVVAVRAGYELLRPNGVLSVMGYIGHAGGAEEARAVETAMDELADRKWIHRDAEVEGSVRPRVLFLLRG